MNLLFIFFVHTMLHLAAEVLMKDVLIYNWLFCESPEASSNSKLAFKTFHILLEESASCTIALKKRNASQSVPPGCKTHGHIIK